MANDYCTIDQLKKLYDTRVVGMLDTDDNDDSIDEDSDGNLQFLLDLNAELLESHLTGKFAIPVVKSDGAAPLSLTKWVAAKAMEQLYARRNDMPPQVESDARWADQYIEDLKFRKIGLPGITRSSVPKLRSSGDKQGRSRFDNIPWWDGRGPADTSTSKGETKPY